MEDGTVESKVNGIIEFVELVASRLGITDQSVIDHALSLTTNPYSSTDAAEAYLARVANESES
jgi:hypothetical protein